MRLKQGWALAACLAVAAPAFVATSAPAHAAGPNKAALKAMLAQCSREADAKGLDVSKGKGAERKAFRIGCMKKMGVEPKA